MGQQNYGSLKNAWLRNTAFPLCNWSGVLKFWFWFLWSIDAVIAGVALYFFFSLAGHGRIGSFNILPWLIILAVLAAVVGGSLWLRSAGQRAVAIVLLLVLAIPGALYVLFFLLLLILHPNFH
jgi:hypothetical protein